MVTMMVSATYIKTDKFFLLSIIYSLNENRLENYNENKNMSLAYLHLDLP